ncbi:uncharacterized protein LOC131937747 [Physella acuta]|uniref:uncharacterized protein LOC131937747 n=1 Tax=Physella acuta TaxID=109671 RepID=UPI0027DDE333|nr:uncharacterized protein LOC131937747 [Physella acuta]
MLALLVLASILASACGKIGEDCHVTSECDPAECCQMLRMYTFNFVHNTMTLSNPLNNATCQRYDPVGEDCDPFDKMSGLCGCEPGSMCSGQDVLTSSLHGRATLPPTPAPGYTRIYECVKEEAAAHTG